MTKDEFVRLVFFYSRVSQMLTNYFIYTPPAHPNPKGPTPALGPGAGSGFHTLGAGWVGVFETDKDIWIYGYIYIYIYIEDLII